MTNYKRGDTVIAIRKGKGFDTEMVGTVMDDQLGDKVSVTFDGNSTVRRCKTADLKTPDLPNDPDDLGDFVCADTPEMFKAELVIRLQHVMHMQQLLSRSAKDHDSKIMLEARAELAFQLLKEWRDTDIAITLTPEDQK